MARTPTPAPIRSLRSPSSLDTQLAALKQLKNDIIGHDQRKEQAIRHGAVPLLLKILTSTERSRGKRGIGAGEVIGAEEDVGAESSPTLEDEVRVEAVVVAGALGNGGLAYISPFVAAGIFSPIISLLSPSANPSKLVTASLRALLVFATSLEQNIEAPESALSPLTAELYSSTAMNALVEILAPRNVSLKVHEQVSLAAQLIGKTCRNTLHQAVLVKAGILDLLTAHLAAFVLAQERALHFTDALEVQPLARLPEPPPKSSLSAICNAISATIHQSAYRTAMLLHSPVVTNSFGVPPDGFPGAQRPAEPASYLLPPIQASYTKAEQTYSKVWPALTTSTNEYTRMAHAAFSATLPESSSQPSSQTILSKDIGSPIFTWLIYLIRTTSGVERLEILRLLTELIRAISQYPIAEPSPLISTRNRDRALAFLVVPLLVKIIDEAAIAEQKLSNGKPDVLPPVAVRQIKELAPELLATLIEGSEALQKAAVDAGVVKKLCTILKKSFDSIPMSKKPMWTPAPQAEYAEHALDEDEAIYALGKQGLPMEAVHAFKCRAAALKALSAVAEKKDEFRRMVIENGVVGCMADSLIPFSSDSPDAKPEETELITDSAKKQGNPVFVLLAGCNAVRALSRSVNILRTSLIDGGISQPIVALLRHESLEVQLAATDVLINFLLHFSPMKDDILQAGALKCLCDHAHSSNPQMRFLSIWALKHLVLKTTNEIKVACLEELGTMWLMQTITGESFPSRALHSSAPLGLGTSNAAGETVDLLNAPDEPAMDLDDDDDEEEEEEEEGYDEMMTDSVDMLRFPRYTSRGKPSQAYRRAIKEIKDQELNPALREQRDDLRIQEVALDFVRNLISDSGAGLNDMIDHVLGALGQTRLFDVLTSKLKGRRLPAGKDKRVNAHSTLISPSPTYSSAQFFPPTSNSNNSSTFFAVPPPSLLKATLYMLVRVGTGSPRHRQLLLTRHALLAAVLPLLAHPTAEVRAACLWIVINLTWTEDQSDRLNARQRAAELRKAGFDEAARRCLADGDLDVRERAKTAVEQLRELEGEWGRHGSSQR